MTGFQLKLLAMIAMTLDHIGCIFFPRLPLLRMIGRLAMPILCFFIGEGLRHTRNPQKYLLRLVGFALISELPFDLAFYGRVNWASQNVYFTLALGLMALRLLQSSSPRRWAGLLSVGGAALLLRADYGLYGIAMILLLDRFRDSLSEQFASLALLNLLLFGFGMQSLSLLSLPLLCLYNGQRGCDDKKFFYAYYPAHLLLLWGLGSV